MATGGGGVDAETDSGLAGNGRNEMKLFGSLLFLLFSATSVALTTVACYKVYPPAGIGAAGVWSALVAYLLRRSLWKD